VITSSQLRAARALLAIDQRELAALSHLSLQTIRRMETSQGIVRGQMESLTKLIEALDKAGVALIGPEQISPHGGRGVRLKAANKFMR